MEPERLDGPGPSGRGRFVPALEPLAAVLAWLLLFWLSRQPACVEGACSGAGGGGWRSVALALAAAWLAPGWMLWRMMGVLPGLGGAVAAAGFAWGLGLVWLVLMSAAVLWLGLALDQLLLAACAGGGLLTVLFLAWSVREGRRRQPAARSSGPVASVWPVAMAVTAFVALLGVAHSSSGFTYGGDEWFYLRAVRQYLDGRGWIYDFDVWELVLALVVRLAGVPLLDGYRVLLPPFLIAASALTYVALARATLLDGRAVAFAFVLQALYCLSDMNTRGSGAGMALLARVVEDKYIALLLVVPLAQAALLSFANGGPPRLLLAFAGLAVAGELVHPLAAVWLAASTVVLALAWVRERGPRLQWRWLASAGVLALATLGLGLWLRSIRNPSYFQLLAPDAPFHAALMRVSQRELIVLSLEKGWYMGDPRLLQHPLVVAALLGALWLALRPAASRRRWFLVGATAVPLVLVFTPFAATWLGSLISPWMVPRLLWVMPVTLTLAAVWHDRLAALESALGRPARAGASSASWTVALVVTAALLAPRIVRSVEALHQRNRVQISKGERELMEFLASDPHLGGSVLAPRGLSVRIPSWTSRVRALPGPDALRGGLAPATADGCERLLASRAVGDEQAALLNTLGIGHVVVRNGSTLGRKLGRLEPAFTPRFRGAVYTLYTWRPERWPQALLEQRRNGR